jgi:hypothetical protein
MSFLKTLNPQDGIIDQSDFNQYKAVESFGADPMHLEHNKIPLNLNWQKKEEIKEPTSDQVKVKSNFPFLPLPPDAYRSNGSLKSAVGWKGAIKNNITGKTMTELSIGAPNTEEGFYPLINPYTTDEQIEYLKNNNFEGNTQELHKDKIGKDMLSNARRHYDESTEKGLSPFNTFYTDENPLGVMNPEESQQENPFVNSRGGEILHNYKSEDGIFLWQESAQRLYEDPNLFPEMYKPMDFNYNASPEEISEWALEFVARIANNLVYGGVALDQFNKLSNESKLDIYRLLKMYEDSEATGVANLWYEDENQKFDGVAWDGIFRALRGIGTDPSTWTGGLIYKGGAKLLAKLSGKVGKGTLASKIMKAMLSPTMLVSVEGGVYSSAFDYQMQQYQIQGQATNPETFGGMSPPENNPFPTELNKTSLVSSYALGAVFGPAFEQAVPLTKKAYNKLNEIYEDMKIPDNPNPWMPDDEGGSGSVDIDKPDGPTNKQILVKEMEEINARILKFEKDNNIDLNPFNKDYGTLYPKTEIGIRLAQKDTMQGNYSEEIIDMYNQLINEKFKKENEIENEPITLFHGSPHQFDEFDVSKIGSGEGHQAYSHGLYFAEEEEVSEIYKGFLGKRVEISGVETIKDGRRTNLTDSLDGNEAQKYRFWSDMIKHYDPEEMPELTLKDVVEDSYDQKKKDIDQSIEIRKYEIEKNESAYNRKDEFSSIYKDIIQRTIDHLNKTKEDPLKFLESLTDGPAVSNNRRVPDFIKYGDLSEEEFFKKYNIFGDSRLRWVALTYKETLTGIGDTNTVSKYAGDNPDGTAKYIMSEDPTDQKSQGVDDSLFMFQRNPDLLKKRHDEVLRNNYDRYTEDYENLRNKLNDAKDKQRELDNNTSELMNLINDGEIKIENTGSMYETEVDIKPSQTIDYNDYVNRDVRESLSNLVKDLLEENNMSMDKFQDVAEREMDEIFGDSEKMMEFTYEGDLDKFLEDIFDTLPGETVLMTIKKSMTKIHQDDDVGFFGSDVAEELRKYLVKHNIKGLKYDDQMSRKGGDKSTHNYVIYDDRIINIVKRYGVSIPMAGYMLSQLDGQNDNQDQIN